MKKLLVLIACAWTISMHAMEVNEQSARAFVTYKGIKQLIINPPTIPCIGDLDVKLLTAEQRSELAILAHNEWTSRYAILPATRQAAAEHKMDSPSLEAEHQINNLHAISEKLLDISANPTKN